MLAPPVKGWPKYVVVKILETHWRPEKDPNMSYRRYPILPHLRPFLSFTSPNLTDEVIGGGNSTSCLQRCFALAHQGGDDVR